MPGKIIPELSINGKPAPYPVLNERAVRAGAGIMFVMGSIAFALALLSQDFRALKIVVVIFFIDFFTKVILGPKFSIISHISNLIVRKQKPEFVGAIQKRFAWSIGLTMASLMIVLLYVFEVRGPINLAVCLMCLTFMWLETSFGICIGCKIYYGLIRLKLIKEPEIAPACPGGACPINKSSN
ncbi:DUF4395 domain-containing protein [Candidatus Peregrinibacteria bacterium]|nr:DUF4395 domain-containing protein [Candidatus Peregrinibacteria bacterium]